MNVKSSTTVFTAATVSVLALYGSIHALPSFVYVCVYFVSTNVIT